MNKTQKPKILKAPTATHTQHAAIPFGMCREYNNVRGSMPARRRERKKNQQ